MKNGVRRLVGRLIPESQRLVILSAAKDLVF
jgi:hypothetical protein